MSAVENDGLMQSLSRTHQVVWWFPCSPAPTPRHLGADPFVLLCRLQLQLQQRAQAIDPVSSPGRKRASSAYAPGFLPVLPASPNSGSFNRYFCKKDSASSILSNRPTLGNLVIGEPVERVSGPGSPNAHALAAAAAAAGNGLNADGQGAHPMAIVPRHTAHAHTCCLSSYVEVYRSRHHWGGSTCWRQAQSAPIMSKAVFLWACACAYSAPLLCHYCLPWHAVQNTPTPTNPHDGDGTSLDATLQATP